MIYSVYFAGIQSYNPLLGALPNGSDESLRSRAKIKNANLTRQQAMATAIKESKGDSFVFITTKEQNGEFQQFLTNHDLRDKILFTMPDYVHNGNHPQDPRRLKLTVLQTKE